MITCREIADFLMAYLDRELPEGQRCAFEQHLGDCPGCVRYLRSYEATVRLGKCLCDDAAAQPPGDVPEELVRAILAARRQGGC